MHKIIRNIVKSRGKEVIASTVLVSCLDDEGAFATIESKVHKRILRAIINDGYAQKLLNVGAWNDESKMLATEYARKNAMTEDTINYVFKCLAYGLGWTRSTPITPQCEVPSLKHKKDSVDQQDLASKVADAEKEVLQSKMKAQEAEKKAKEIERKAIIDRQNSAKITMESERKAHDAELRAKAAEARLHELQRKLSETEKIVQQTSAQESLSQQQLKKAQKKEKKYQEKINNLENQVQEKKTKREIESTFREHQAYWTIGLAWIIWLGVTIYSVFSVSDGFWQTSVAVIVGGGSAFVLAYGSILIDYIIESDSIHWIARIIGTLVLFAIEIMMLVLGLRVVEWFD